MKGESPDDVVAQGLACDFDVDVFEGHYDEALEDLDEMIAYWTPFTR